MSETPQPRGPAATSSVIGRLEARGLRATGGRRVPPKATAEPQVPQPPPPTGKATCPTCGRRRKASSFVEGSEHCGSCRQRIAPVTPAIKGPTPTCPSCEKVRSETQFGPRSKYCNSCRDKRKAAWQKKKDTDHRRWEVQGGAPSLGKRR